ncbi:aldo/keto reductase [Amnibacterium sp.]|uniref:aldo/keto reductase n=1 Tax=Amnibacterium sp. TaxID=1872496 RepID=UPI00262ED7E8|nr:aldo/keto reductase [Amnibacterium sp.]
MHLTPLGPSGRSVTAVVAGAAREPVPVKQGVAALGTGWDLGVRSLDVADVGSAGETAAERFLDDRQPEDTVILAGVGGPAGPERGADHAPERVEAGLAATSRRLGRADLVWLAGADAETPIEATLTALAAAVEDGRVAGWGAADIDVWRLEALLTAADRAALPRPAFVRIRMHLLDRTAERDLLPLATGEGLGVLARAPFAGGRLTDAHVEAEEEAGRLAASGSPRTTPEDPALQTLLTLRGLARERSLSTAALALAWLLGHPGVTAPVVAARSERVWETVHEALEAEIDEELLDRVGALH